MMLMDILRQALNAANPNSAAAVLTASQNVDSTIKAATTTIQGAQALGLADALSLQNTATGLVTSVDTLVTDLEAKKPVLDQLGVSQVAVQTLQQQQATSQALGTAIVSKVPAIGQSIAQQSIAQINTSLQQGIATLSAPAGTKQAIKV
jgi:hypothetical protein